MSGTNSGPPLVSVPASSPEGAAAAARAEPSSRQEGERAVVQAVAAAARLGGRSVWAELSLSVRAGEFAAVLGPNGAGKSTLLKTILGLIPLSAGSMTVLGERPGAANRRIGYLPQRRSFDPAIRIRGIDVVRLGLEGARWGVPVPFLGGARRRAERARLAEVIELVGAEAYARRPIGALSGGEQQRLLIAQALVRRPELLLLDEPLDSLDLSQQAAVAALVERICRAEGVAVLLVAHDVNPILGYLDQVIYFAGGTAVAGTPSEVITGPTLSRLYGAPIEVLRSSDGRLVVVGQPEAPLHHGPRHPH